MAKNTRFVHINAAINDWLEDSGWEGNVDEGLIKKWAQDQTRRFMGSEQLVHKVAAIRVENGMIEVPDDFKSLVQIAYTLDFDKTCTTEVMSQWVHEAWGSDCELEINVKCSECSSTSCTHQSPVVEIDADQIYLQSNPQYAVAYMNHFIGYGRTKEEGPVDTCSIAPHFKLLKPGFASFRNLGHHIDFCPNLEIECEYTYDLEMPYIRFNFEKGWVLLAYLGVRKDCDGYLMIPDTPAAFRAIYWTIQERMMHRRYLKNLGEKERRAHKDAIALQEIWTGRARNELNLPDADEWKWWAKNFWFRMYPYVDAPERGYRYMKERFRYRNETYYG